ncbi:Heme-binding protein 2 [Oryzias melastigma]|uniref:Heme-binding protein 1 n=1 Tax=Oryzias melastigma TaxID=30732 RepID=A0A834BZ39_ORYME|nr:Heme-binding protein 2 [Oryzias melastigma]
MCRLMCVSSCRAFTSLLVVWILAVSAQGSVGPSTSTSFCTESKECLEYELICKTDEYEVRHYSPTRWISTDAEAYFMGVGAAMAFRRLFQYITGANEGGVQMEMTAPVLVKIPEDSKMWGPAIYTLNFLLPAAYQEVPPAPTNDKLYFTEMPHMNVYVRSYGGWMLSIDSRSHTYLLTAELERVRAAYNHSYHYGVGYDSPLKLLNRHNEVWYVAEGQPVCSDPKEPTPAHTTRPTPTQPPSASPSDFLRRMLSDSAVMVSSNVSSNATFNASSLLPSDPSPLLPSKAPTDRPSDQPLNSTHPAPSAQMPLETSTNSSDPVSESPLPELQPDAELWNSTAGSAMDSEAEPSAVSESANAV